MEKIIIVFVLMEGLSCDKYRLLQEVLIRKHTYEYVAALFSTDAQTIQAIFSKLVDICKRTYGINLVHMSEDEIQEQVSSLSSSQNPVMRKVGTHVQLCSTQEQILMAMVFDRDPQVRKLVAQFCQTPYHLLEHLSRDPESAITVIARGRLQKRQYV